LLHPIQQAGDVRHAPDEPLPDFLPAQAVLPGATQDTEGVVLGRRNAVRPERLRDGVLHDGRGARDAEQRLFLEALERLVLLELGLQRAAHVITICVLTHIVKPGAPPAAVLDPLSSRPDNDRLRSWIGHLAATSSS